MSVQLFNLFNLPAEYKDGTSYARLPILVESSALEALAAKAESEGKQISDYVTVTL